MIKSVVFLIFWISLVSQAIDTNEFNLIDYSKKVSLYSRNNISQNSLNNLKNAINLVSLNPAGTWGILIDPTWKNSSGYFSPNLKTPKGDPAILLTPESLLDDKGITPLLAHEITHLIHFQNRPHEESWIQEGVALLMEYKITGDLSPLIIESFEDPQTSLTQDLHPTQLDYIQSHGKKSQYGHLFLYFYYLYRLCGKDTLLSELLTSKSSKAGVLFMDKILEKMESQNPVCRDFKSSFKAFQIARLTPSYESKSSYVILSSLQVTPQQSAPVLPPFSGGVYQLKENKKCEEGDTPRFENLCVKVRFE